MSLSYRPREARSNPSLIHMGLGGDRVRTASAAESPTSTAPFTRSGCSTKGPPDMHDHRYCEQQIAAAIRTNNTGRAEYLSTRCDREHGDLTDEQQGEA